MFSLLEFIELEPDEIQDWWVQHHLPSPGCPESTKMVHNLIWVCHRVPHSREFVRAAAISLTCGSVYFDSQVRVTIRNDEPGKHFNLDVAKFYFPYKSQHILVPLDTNDRNTYTDMQLVRILYA